MSSRRLQPVPPEPDRRARQFRLQAGESLADGVRRMAEAQLAGSLELLAGQGDPASAVHETRKSIKRLRALARLVREDIGEPEYRRENASLRDTARSLAAARDAEVLLDTLRELRRHRRALETPAVDALTTILAAEAARARAALRDRDVQRAEKGLRLAEQRVVQWPLREGGPAAIERGLAKLYGRGRREMRRARAERNPESLHDWRKSVKYLRHAAEALEPARPGMLGKAARRAERLGELLGEDHDLAELRATVLRYGSKQAMRPVLRAIDGRREKLEKRALRLGGKLYRRPPKRFARRVARGLRRHGWASA